MKGKHLIGWFAAIGENLEEMDRRTVCSVLMTLLKEATSDYAESVFEEIKNSVLADVSIATDFFDDGFTDEDVKLAIGRALLNRLNPDNEKGEENAD